MLTVQFDSLKFTRWLNDAAQKQFPYACSKALTELAKRGQQEVRTGIERNMVVRRPWVMKGVAVKAARKGDGIANMQAEIGSRDWFMQDQLGDGKSTRKGSGKQFVPIGARKSIFQVVPARLRPAPVTAQSKSTGKFFFKQGRGGRNIVYQKMRGNRLRLMYSVAKTQEINPKFSLHDNVARVVLRHADREFIRQMQAAIKTAK